MCLIALFSAMGYGPAIYNKVADHHLDMGGNLLVALTTLILISFFVFDLHRKPIFLQLIASIGVFCIILLAGIFKAIKYPWVPMAICMFCPVVLFGLLRVKVPNFTRANMTAKQFMTSVGIGCSICAMVVALAWMIWVVKDDRWLDEETEDWLVSQHEDVYRHIYDEMALNYTADCKAETENLARLGLTEQETAEVKEACDEAQEIWSLQWCSPSIAFMCNCLGACFCILFTRTAPTAAHHDSATSAMMSKNDFDHTVLALKKFVLAISFAFAGLYCSLYVSGAAQAMASMMVCVAAIVTSATLGWIYLEVDHSKIQEVIMDSKIGHNIMEVLHSDWTRAVAVAWLHVFIPGMAVLDILRMKQRRYFGTVEEGHPQDDIFTAQGRRIKDELDRWYWVSILKKVNLMCEMFMLCFVGAKVTFVFFSWLVDELEQSGIDFMPVAGMVLFIGLGMFMCPIVPGSAVYLFAGVVLSGLADSTGFGLWPGFIIACTVASVAKMLACVLQYFLGFAAGKNVRVQKFVGVDTISIRATEFLLRKPGFSVGKVCILVAGPDFPTSMLCGILKLNIPQMLLGTSPVILVSIIPQTLVGALLGKDGVYGMLSTVATGGAAALQGAAILLFTWELMKVMQDHAEDLQKPRPEHAAVAQLTQDERRVTKAYYNVTQWDALSVPQKTILCSSTGLFLFCCLALAADCVTEPFCFRNFSIEDDIDAPIKNGGLDGDWTEIAMPFGKVMLLLAVVAFVFDFIFQTWLGREAKTYLAANPDACEEAGDTKPRVIGKGTEVGVAATTATAVGAVGGVF